LAAALTWRRLLQLLKVLQLLAVLLQLLLVMPSLAW
jgi:hypothetical protein